MAREVRLWEWLRDGLRAVGELHLCRVENSAMAGYPDVEGCWIGKCFHLELKGADRPADPSTPVRLGVRPEQVVWLRRRWRCGGNAWLYVRVGAGADVRRYLLPGVVARQAGAGMTEGELLAASRLSPAHTQWDLVLAAVDRGI